MSTGRFFLFVVIGFAAQMIDGTLGMAYGVSSRTFLKTVAGLPTALASAVVHASEVPTTLVSGISHWKLGNVEMRRLKQLIVPGVLGGIIGAWFLAGSGDRLEPFIDIYLVIMGIIILRKAIWRNDRRVNIDRAIYPLGFAGGFFDAAGGGGWGPIVTSTMVASGNDVKKSIGTVNTAEFLVTVAETTTFAVLLQDMRAYGSMILAMIMGGVVAAPIAAYLCRKIPSRPLMLAVGVLIILLNLWNFYLWIKTLSC